MARKSFGPRPTSLAVDKSAPVDEQISHIKNIFNRGSAAAHDAQGPGHGEPLSEIKPPGENLDVE
jgi:hypothetical protein